MRLSDYRYLQTILLWLWAPSAYATTVTLGTSLASVPALAWALVCVLSSVSGLAALLNRIKDLQPARPALFMAAHMLGSMLAGALTFLALQGFGGVNDFLQTVVISVAAYAGATLLDSAADTLNARVRTLSKPQEKSDAQPKN